MADLCDAYYEPLMTFLRCELRDAEAARELGHAFFEKLLEGGAIHTADESRGRFRSYLLGAVKHFLSHQREAAQRQKRGGGELPVSMDDEAVQKVEDRTQLTPDEAFDRQWAITVLARGLEVLQSECQAEGQGIFFEQVKPLLTGEAAHGEQSMLGEQCGLNAAAFRMKVHRLKKRLRQHVKAEVAGTLDDAAMVDEEMRTLFTALGG